MLSRILFAIFWLAKATLLGLGLLVLASVCFGYYCGIKAAEIQHYHVKEEE